MTTPTVAPPAITLLPSVYTAGGQSGDYVWMLAQPAYARALFIFNDNEPQFLAFQSGIQPGGGNGVIRPFQADYQRAAGIPTGPNYTSLTPQVQAMIDMALAHIGVLLKTGKYDTLVYSVSATDPNRIGTNIFAVGDDVRAAIITGIRALLPAPAPVPVPPAPPAPVL